MIPKEFIDKYNINYKVHNGYILVWVTNVMYGLPQTGRIANDALFQQLATYGYHTSKNTPELWTHNSFPINFTLVVNDFVVRYSRKYHSLHLKS